MVERERKKDLGISRSKHTAIESGEDPWFVRVEVDSLYPLAAGIELALEEEDISMIVVVVVVVV